MDDPRVQALLVLTLCALLVIALLCIAGGWVMAGLAR